MGYEIHITRKENWFDEDGPEISSAEWLDYIASDSEMRLDGYAEAALSDGAVLRTVNQSIAVWIAHPLHGKRKGMAWIWWCRGSVEAKNPDDSMLKKMCDIAQALGAKVQGDEGELYDKSEIVIEPPQPPVQPAKPWWRFW